jgi:hypothetical protein
VIFKKKRIGRPPVKIVVLAFNTKGRLLSQHDSMLLAAKYYDVDKGNLFKHVKGEGPYGRQVNTLKDMVFVRLKPWEETERAAEMYGNMIRMYFEIKDLPIQKFFTAYMPLFKQQ